MKSLSSLLITSAVIAVSSTASAALVAGDIAIVGFQASGVTTDSIAFASLVNLDAGTVVYFTDNGFTTGSGFRGVLSTDNDGNENLMKFTVGSGGLAAGTVISSRSTAYASNWTLSGQISSTGGTATYSQLSLSSTGEQITALISDNVQPLLSG